MKSAIRWSKASGSTRFKIERAGVLGIRPKRERITIAERRQRAIRGGYAADSWKEGYCE